MVLSTLRPPVSAHIDAPLPRCATITRPAAIVRGNMRQPARDVLIRQAVKAVAPHALRIEPLRDCVVIGERAVAAMKRGVEAGDLWEIAESAREWSGSARGCSAGAAAPAARNARAARAHPRRPAPDGRNRARRARRDDRPRSDGRSCSSRSQSPRHASPPAGRRTSPAPYSRSTRRAPSAAGRPQPRARADAVHLALDLSA